LVVYDNAKVSKLAGPEQDESEMAKMPKLRRAGVPIFQGSFAKRALLAG
jgi:hypothetical protein